MDEIDGKKPNLVRALAAQGLSVEDIAGMTRTSESFVRDILDLRGDSSASARLVNTTSESK